MAKAPSEPKVPIDSSLTLVCYCDGSARPTNPGYAGYGVFAYTYRASVRPKNTKHPIKAALSFTPQGVSKDKSEAPIEVVDILEASVALQGDTHTNNIAELKAALHSLKWTAALTEVTQVKIITDSRYFVNNFTEHLKTWADNGFKKLDGETVKNVEVWGEIELTRRLLQERGVTIEVIWVKGHSEDYGNEMADTLSVIASNAARIQQQTPHTPFNEVILDTRVSYSEFKKSYDNKDVVYHFKDLFFSSQHKDDQDHCFLASTEDETNTGRRTTDAIFAVNQGKVPPLIERVRQFYRNLPRSYVCNCSMRLSRFENRDILRLAESIDVGYLLLPIPKSANQFTLIGTERVFLQENTMDFPFIVNISKLTNAILNILGSASDKQIHVDITERVIQDNKLLITNKDRHLDLSEDVKGKIQFCQRPLLGIGYDIPNYLTLKRIDTELQSVQAVFHKSEHSNFYTLYTKLITPDRTLCCINMVDKYLAVPAQIG